ALSGIAVCGLGHAHPAVTAAIKVQVDKLLHASNLFESDLQEKLANLLADAAGMDKVFFGNSGAEANEAAIKMARLYGNKVRQVESPSIIVAEGAFHGRTLATLTATGNRKIQAGFEPLVSGFVRAPFNDVDSIRTIAKNNPRVVAVLIEPIQGESGLNTPAGSYIAELRTVCDENDCLLMLDEIQTGNGRTGQYFNFQYSDIVPDIVTTAKGLGNGMPIGACIVAGRATDLFQPGHHGSTFGGNPVACAAAIAVLETIQTENLIDRATRLGTRIRDGMQALLADDIVREWRGKGCMIGLQLHKPCTELVSLALQEGLVINVTADDVVRLLPPLIMSDEQADLLVDKLSKLINSFCQS
ncbi:MAG: aspartate aminotransferase family protein, partial [Pseudomonadales bacterium]